MKIIPENKFAICRTAKDAYTCMDRLELLRGITINDRKLIVYLCNQIDFEKAENPIHVGIEEFRNNYIIPGLTAASFVAMIDSLAQRGFWLRKEDGTTCLVRIIDKAEYDGKGTFNIRLHDEWLCLKKEQQTDS